MNNNVVNSTQKDDEQIKAEKRSVTDQYGHQYLLTKELSKGAQGAVYVTNLPNLLVKISASNDDNIVDEDTILFKNKVYDMVRILPIGKKTNIILPLSILEDAIGYTMELLEDMDSLEDVFRKNDRLDIESRSVWLEEQYRTAPDFAKLFDNYIATGGLRKRLLCLIMAAITLSKIHMNGLVYGDLSLKNIFVSKEKDYHETWFIDSDNLDYLENAECRGSGWKTPGYGAPEIYKGSPNTMYSDAFTFAMIAFVLLTDIHPFVGEASRRLEIEVDKDIYHEYRDFSNYDMVEELSLIANLPWIGDPIGSNDIKWPYGLYITNELYALFQQTFGIEGKSNLIARATLPEWIDILVNAYDHVVRCKHCGMSYYACDYPGKQNNDCPWCDGKSEKIVITSFLVTGEQQKLEWTCIHEATEGTIDVPLRLVQTGFDINAIEDVLCRLQITNEGFIVGDWHRDYKCTLYTDSSEILSYYSYKTKTKDSLQLNAIHTKTEIQYYIEIKVE